MDTGIVYGHGVTWMGDTIDLKLNVHYPKPSLDPFTKHPFVMMVFGGAFRAGKRQDVDRICEEFARRGFVSASMDYRIGWDTTCVDSTSYLKAVYRAMQDLHAAMRFVSANATAMRVDTAWLFAGGESAGSGTVLGLVYTSQQEIDAIYPQLSVQLKKLNKADNNLTNNFTLKGVFNNWGSVEDVFYDAADALPMVSFHGDADGVVDIDSAQELNCLHPPLPWARGSRALHYRLIAAGVCSDLTVRHNGNHGVFQDSIGKSFRVGRAACFFKNLFCNSCVSGYRVTKDPDPQNTNCPPTTAPRMGIGGINTDNGFNCYPNPATGIVTISGVDRLKDFTISICDAAGRLVLQTSNKTTIDIAQLSRGMYIVKLQQEGRTSVRMLVKE
jgi:acetyl esterase/lipase